MPPPTPSRKGSGSRYAPQTPTRDMSSGLHGYHDAAVNTSNFVSSPLLPPSQPVFQYTATPTANSYHNMHRLGARYVAPSSFQMNDYTSGINNNVGGNAGAGQGYGLHIGMGNGLPNYLDQSNNNQYGLPMRGATTMGLSHNSSFGSDQSLADNGTDYYHSINGLSAYGGMDVFQMSNLGVYDNVDDHTGLTPAIEQAGFANNSLAGGDAYLLDHTYGLVDDDDAFL